MKKGYLLFITLMLLTFSATSNRNSDWYKVNQLGIWELFAGLFFSVAFFFYNNVWDNINRKSK